MNKYEVKQDTQLTALKGSLVFLTSQQAELLGARVEEVKEKKPPRKKKEV